MRKVLVPAAALLIGLAPQVQARSLQVHVSVGGYSRPTARSLLAQRLLRPKSAMTGATTIKHEPTNSYRSVLDDLANQRAKPSMNPCAFQALAVVGDHHWCDKGDVAGGFCVLHSSIQK